MTFENDDQLSILASLTTLRRPKMLMQTARHGVVDYDRNTDLRRVLKGETLPPPGLGCLSHLLEIEETLERRRTRPHADPGTPWRAAQHVDVLIALMAESAPYLHRVSTAPGRFTVPTGFQRAANP